MKHRRRAAYILCAAMISTATWLVPGAAHAAGPAHVREGEQGKCLDVKTQDGIFNEGARLQRFTCHDVDEQKFDLVEASSGALMLRNIKSQLCVAVDSAEDGAQVVQRRCEAANRGALWTPVPTNTGTNPNNPRRILRSGLAPDSCLDTFQNFVKIFHCNTPSNTAQQWTFI